MPLPEASWEQLWECGTEWKKGICTEDLVFALWSEFISYLGPMREL
jgi:hypothetical protein